MNHLSLVDKESLVDCEASEFEDASATEEGTSFSCAISSRVGFFGEPFPPVMS